MMKMTEPMMKMTDSKVECSNGEWIFIEQLQCWQVMLVVQLRWNSADLNMGRSLTVSDILVIQLAHCCDIRQFISVFFLKSYHTILQYYPICFFYFGHELECVWFSFCNAFDPLFLLLIDCPKSGPGPHGPRSGLDWPHRSKGPGQWEVDWTPILSVQVQIVSGPDLGVGPGPDLYFHIYSKVVYYTYTVSNIIFILI